MILFLWAPFFLLVVVPFLVIVRRHRSRGRRSPLNENLLRSPALSLRRKQEDLMLDGIMYWMGIALFPMTIYAAYLQSGRLFPILFLTAGVAVTCFCAYRAFKRFRVIIEKLHQAIDAETATGQELSYLMREGAWVFHDIPYQYGNIDHIVVSKGGVFAIETKGYSKTDATRKANQNGYTVIVQDGVLLLPNAKTSQPINQATTHAKWLKAEIERRTGLSVPVRPVVAMPGWMVKGGWDDDCWVINPKRGRSLKKQVNKSLIAEEDVTRIAAWLEDLSRSVVPKSKDFDPPEDWAAHK